MMKKLKIFLLILIVGLFFTNPTLAQTPISTDSLILQLQQQVKALQEQLLKLQAEVSSTKTELEAVKTELKFTKILRLGVRGDEVTQLQEFLKQFPDIYPQGLVTGYFGPLTESAVKKFQEKNKIESIGVVGPKTISKLNELITEGAGKSDIIPPGLLIVPVVQTRIGTTTPSATATPTISTSSPQASSGQATTTPATATTTPAGTTPATPATSANPATPTSVSGGPTVSATPAAPAVPASAATTTATTASTTIQAPTNLVGTVSATANVNSPLVTLGWTVTTQPTNEFKIFRKISGGSWTKIWGGNPNTNNFSQQTYFGTYDYRVQACNVDSCSPDSNIVTLVVSGPDDTQPPSIPTNLIVKAVSWHQIDLAWSPSSDNVSLQGYKMYRNGDFLKTTANNNEYDNTVSPSTFYSYTVSAYDASGNVSAQSDSVSTTTPSAPTSLDLRAQNLSAISQMVNSLSEILKELSKLLK